MSNIGKLLILIGLSAQLVSVYGQTSQDTLPISSITISECYEWSRNNYPLITKLDLLAKSTQFSLSNASKGNLPQININGQATYQSEVTELPIDLPELEIPTLDQDQYNIYGEIYQPLSNFSNIKSQKDEILINGQIEKQEVEVDLYQLKDRVNQIYFGILLFEVKNEQLSLAKADLDSTISKLEAAIDNGTVALMDKKLLEVEKIGVDQQINENESNRESFLIMLSVLTGKKLDLTTRLVLPKTVNYSFILKRPELNLFDLQEQRLDIQRTQINNRLIPNLGLFFQGGYGRPALNFLSNDFSTYYLTGLKLNWNLSKWYNAKNDKQNIEVWRKLINSQRETFLLNTTITQSQQSTEVSKYDKMIIADNQAVKLREEIKNSAEVQLVNGLITTIDYIKILNDASRARQQLELHELMRLQAQYNLKTTTGN